jgi:hypothetical protein
MALRWDRAVGALSPLVVRLWKQLVGGRAPEATAYAGCWASTPMRVPERCSSHERRATHDCRPSIRAAEAEWYRGPNTRVFWLRRRARGRFRPPRRRATDRRRASTTRHGRLGCGAVGSAASARPSSRRRPSPTSGPSSRPPSRRSALPSSVRGAPCPGGVLCCVSSPLCVGHGIVPSRADRPDRRDTVGEFVGRSPAERSWARSPQWRSGATPRGRRIRQRYPSASRAQIRRGSCRCVRTARPRAVVKADSTSPVAGVTPPGTAPESARARSGTVEMRRPPRQGQPRGHSGGVGPAPIRVLPERLLARALRGMHVSPRGAPRGPPATAPPLSRGELAG